MDGIRQIISEKFNIRLDILEKNQICIDEKIKSTYKVLEDTDSKISLI
jgi:hypothetical protein